MDQALRWALLVLPYFAGSIPVGVIVAAWPAAARSRTIGSGRTGGTNALRALGPSGRPSSSPATSPRGRAGPAGPDARRRRLPGEVLVAGAAVAGSVRSVFLNFSGGRGVGTGVGTMLVIQPLAVILAAPVFFLVILATRYVSLEDIIGDYRAFAAQQRDRLPTRGIDIAPYALSHLAYRVPEWDQYVHVRTLLERHAVANRENVWNGRPISLIVPRRAARSPRRQGRPAHRAHPARAPARLQDGVGAPRRRGRRHVRRVRRSPQARPDGTAIPGPEQHTRPRLHPVRGLHPREVLSTFTEGIRRARCWPVRRRVPPRRRLGAPAARDGGGGGLSRSASTRRSRS